MPMIDYTYPECIKCGRVSACYFPCNEYVNYKAKQDLARDEKNIQEEIAIMDNQTTVLLDCGEIDYGNEFDNFMSKLLKFNVDSPEYLQILNGLRDASQIVNFKVLLEYMSERNREYSEWESLCEICHENLQLDRSGEQPRKASCRNGCI